MKRYKNVFNILALVVIFVFFAWMFSTATPRKEYTENWKPKHSLKHQTMVVELKTPIKLKPMSEILFPPKSPF